MCRLLAAAALLVLPLLFPATVAASVGATFSVKQVVVPRETHPRGLKADRNDGKQLLSGTGATSLAAAQRGSSSLRPIAYDESFLVPVRVGNNTLNVILDTGSSDLWVFSKLMNKSQTTGHRLYDPDTGTKLEGYSFDITYAGAGSAEGEVYADKVAIGGVTATSFAVEAATSVSSNLVDEKQVDGFLGLGFRKLNTVSPKQQKTFFETISPTLARKLFTVNLKHNAPGEITFGYIDSSAYTGSIVNAPVINTEGSWIFHAGEYSVGEGEKSEKGSIGLASADTDAIFMYLPSAVAKAYWAQVPSANYSSSVGGYIVPCNATIPDFNVEIGGHVFTVYGDYINYVPVSSTVCYGGIQSKNGFPFSLFGGVFFESVYTVFDQTRSSPRLGFAQKDL